MCERREEERRGGNRIFMTMKQNKQNELLLNLLSLRNQNIRINFLIALILSFFFYQSSEHLKSSRTCNQTCIYRLAIIYIYLQTVLVHLDYYNNSIDQVAYNKYRYLVLTILETGRSKIRTPADLCLVRAHFLVHRWTSLPCVLTQWKRHGSSLGSLL